MYRDIFLRICRIYVTVYPEYAFQFYFDWEKQDIIGTSDKIIPVKIRNTEGVFARIFEEGSMGLWESYCDGSIEVADNEYKEFLFIFVRTAFNSGSLWRKLSVLDIMRILKLEYARKFFTKWTQEVDINSHYSLSDWFKNEEDSNAFYLEWLDARYIQYSCWKWDEWTKTLEEAQLNKLGYYAKRLGIHATSSGKTLLDLGCGWGWLMFYMAETFWVKCHWLTLSIAQAAYVDKEIKRRWLEDLVSVEIRNIHDMEWIYDYIISIGVIEHVSDYDDLYKKISKSLKQDGKALIHAMFHPLKHERDESDPFLTKYIFPGWGIPQLERNMRTLKKYFKYVDWNKLPDESYPKTLQCWYDTFCEREDEIRTLLEEKGKYRNVDFAIRVFKHYLISAYCALYETGLVCNILVSNYDVSWKFVIADASDTPVKKRVS